MSTLEAALAIVGAIWLACCVILVGSLVLGHVATERKARQWRRQFRSEIEDEGSVHEWLDGAS